MAAPYAESGWADNNPETGAPGETQHDAPVADEPYERVGSESELEEGKVVDMEAVEETGSSSNDDEKEYNEKSYNEKSGGAKMQRLQSGRSIATTTSVATTEHADTPASEPRQRTTWQKINPLKHKHLPPVPEQRRPSREATAGFFSKLTFQWISPLMSVGYQRPLDIKDVWAVNPKREVDLLAANLMAALKKRNEAGSKRPLTMALFDTFKREFVIGGACQLTSAITQILSPFVLKYLINFAAEAYVAANDPRVPAPDIAHGIGLAIGITCMQVVQSFCTNHFIYRGMMLGGEARSVLIAVIFEKSMKLSGRARAGGMAKSELREEMPTGIQPGSQEEKSWFKKKLEKKKPTAKPADTAGWSNGRIVNLMSTDTYRIDQAAGLFHIVWTAPIQVFLALALLLVNLTYSALAGFGFICIMMPLLGKAIGSLMKRRKAINKITDQRVSLTQEIIASVRFVKYFGWETSFLDRLDAIRSNEISKISFLLSIRNGIMAVSMTTPIFASMLSFVTYRLSEHVLNPAPIFSSLALFNSLRIPLNMLPMVIGQVVDGFASVARIQDFLAAEEVVDEATWDFQAANAIEISNADFTWERPPVADKDAIALKNTPATKQEAKDAKAKAKNDKKRTKQLEKEKEKLESPPATPSNQEEEDNEQPFQVRNLDLSVKRNELIAVIGSVGSGKSSLLGALAGDMRRISGNVTFGSTRAFCPQYAWIQNATVQQNILFGKDYDRKWYNEVVDACALRPDLEMLPSGDLTEIGERGITVSGGQKQRLNIARAIYFDADIILMDDPLSAVDAHVGRHIMDNAICGLLKDKCRILATHQLHVLHRVDRIVWMKEGTVHKIATFQELMKDDEEFQQLMATTSVEEQHEKEDHANDDEVEDEKKTAAKKKGRKPAGALMSAEEKAVSSVGWSVYAAFVRAAGSMWVAPAIALLLVISQGANIITSLWLSWWTSDKYVVFSELFCA